jgi:hypothetical protein
VRNIEEAKLPSFGSLVEIWIAAIDQGVYEFLPDKGYAIMHHDRLEPGRWPDGLP